MLLAGGTGNPFFTTDTGAALRAAELKADAVFKGTTVEGVYDSDPRKNPNAKKFDELTYKEILSRGLAALDSTATSLSMDNNIPVLLFALEDPMNIVRAICGEKIGTMIHQ